MTNAADMTAEPLDYRNKLILAPMVRVGTLPMRLLALEFGAGEMKFKILFRRSFNFTHFRSRVHRRVN